MIPQADTLSVTRSTVRIDETTNHDLSLTISPALFEAIAHRAAELVPRGFNPDPYLSAVRAAEYLDCPLSRIYALVAARQIPHHRDGSRLLFRCSELDAWIQEGGAKRP